MTSGAHPLACWVADEIQAPPFELPSRFSRGRSIKTLTPVHWKRLRVGALERAGRRCEVCGTQPTRGTRPLEVHESWHYEIPERVQWLARLWTLCRRCHQLAHVQTGLMGSQVPDGVRREFDARVRTATVAARPRRFMLFRIDLRCSGEDIPADLIAAFQRADTNQLASRVREVVRREFDEPLRRKLAGEWYRPGRGPGAADGLLAQRAEALADPGVLAMVCAANEPWEQWTHRRRVTEAEHRWQAAVATERAPDRRHTYGGYRWSGPTPKCASCGRLKPARARDWGPHPEVGGAWRCPTCASRRLPAGTPAARTERSPSYQPGGS